MAAQQEPRAASKPARDAAEGGRRRGRLADRRGRPARCSMPPAAPPSPASAISIRACSRRWRSRRRNSPMPIPASSPPSRPKRWPSKLVGHEPGGLATPISSAADRKRSRPASSWRGNISSRCGQPQRQHFIARRQSYHGNTLGALAAGGNAWRREPYAPLLSPAFSHVTPAFAYHEKRDDESEADFVARLAAELEAEFQRLGPDTVAAFIAEPVVGATAGCVPRAGGLFPRRARDLRPARRAADPRRGDVRHGPHRHAACLGAGRHRARYPGDRQGARRRLSADRRDARERRASSTPSATARARSSTATPIWRIRSPAPRRSRCSGSSTTSICSTGSRSAARQLERRLTERFGNHRHVGDIRGRGLFQAIELVADRATPRAVRSRAEAATSGSRRRRSTAGSAAIRRAAPWTAAAATMSCWRRPISRRRTIST